MALHDVFVAPDRQGRLLVVQSDLLSSLNTIVVVPLLRPEDAPKPARRLNPVCQLSGESYVMVTQFLAAVPVSMLSIPEANSGQFADEITNALDMLFHGF